MRQQTIVSLQDCKAPESELTTIHLLQIAQHNHFSRLEQTDFLRVAGTPSHRPARVTKAYIREPARVDAYIYACTTLTVVQW